MKILKVTAVAVMLATGFAAAASADDKAFSPAAMEQVTIANKLIALGRAKNDPLLLIAAAYIRSTLSDDAIGTLDAMPSQSALLDEAKKLSNGREDFVGLVDDMAASKSKGCYNWNGGTGAYSCPYNSQFAN
ncbi:MAG: hypothetical protein AB7L41_01295 [Flavobacteriaceae bacterium]